MLDEVADFYGGFHHPSSVSRFKRGGSAKGSIRLDGEKISVKRPRVHSGGREVRLASYAAGKSADAVKAAIFEAPAAGVSSREVHRLFWGIPEISRSSDIV